MYFLFLETYPFIILYLYARRDDLARSFWSIQIQIGRSFKAAVTEYRNQNSSFSTVTINYVRDGMGRLGKRYLIVERETNHFLDNAEVIGVRNEF